jgi:hypothetical protein
VPKHVASISAPGIGSAWHRPVPWRRVRHTYIRPTACRRV